LIFARTRRAVGSPRCAREAYADIERPSMLPGRHRSATIGPWIACAGAQASQGPAAPRMWSACAVPGRPRELRHAGAFSAGRRGDLPSNSPCGGWLIRRPQPAVGRRNRSQLSDVDTQV